MILFLFDVDGTLIWSGGAGSQALRLAMRDLFSMPDGMAGIVCDGKTDPGIVREALSRRGAVEPPDVRRVLELYLDHLRVTVPASDSYDVLPGVEDSLRHLAAMDDVLVGLATGNIEQGARVKLEPAGINHYFEFGGFGSDAEERYLIVEAGIRRGRERSTDPHAVRPIVIGDTPLDVAAAQRAGARTVGVATGRYSATELAECGADLVLENLEHPERWVPQAIRVACS